jgi:hypothetical protein
MRDDRRRGQLDVSISCCLSATGIRFSDHPFPAGDLGLPCGWLTGHCPDLIGVPRFARASCDRGGCPLDPGDGGTHTTGNPSPAAACRIATAKSLPPAKHPSSEVQCDEASLRVHCIHPSGLPLACGSRMDRAPLGFSPELRTPPSPAAHVRVGTGLEYWPGTTQSTSSVDPPFCEPARNVRPRVARGCHWTRADANATA